MSERAVAPWHIAVDIGGTFTDVVLADAGGSLFTVKSPSRPEDPAAGLIAALELLAQRTEMSLNALLADCALFVHGSTVATNILLEGKGAKAGLLTTEGFRDSLEIRRGKRTDPWDHRRPYPPVLIPRYLRLPVTERTDRNGAEFQPVDAASVERALAIFQAEQVESVAICFLNSYLDPAHERQVAAMVRQALPGIPVTVSSDLVALAGEYARTSTAAVDAYVGPRLIAYLERLKALLAEHGLTRPLLIVKNNGGTAPVDAVVREPVALTLSGPAAAVGALERIRASLGDANLISVEVGGTSCDVMLMAGGKVNATDHLSISDYEILMPSVEVHTVGAGGGTIAGVDAAGMLFVGPKGAGARPGPACYGLGGTEPTVTDAQLVLGRLRAGLYAGGTLTLDLALAERAIRDKLAGPLGLTVEQAAAGLLRVAEQNMLNAVSYVSVQRGLDPRPFTLVSGGGAGALHITAIARRLGCRQAYVPRLAGVFCALGMLNSDVRHDFAKTRLAPLAETAPASAEADFAALERQAVAILSDEGFALADQRLERELELRYRGQQWDVRVPLAPGPLDWTSVRRDFEREYEILFGHSQPEAEVEIVKLRLAAFGILKKPPLRRMSAGATAAQPIETRAVYLDEKRGRVPMPIYGTDLTAGTRLQGPLIVEEATTTILVGPDDVLSVDDTGNYLIGFGGRG